MKAISLWQPHATLSVKGEKLVETRGWSTNIRGEVAIHAAKTRDGLDVFRHLKEKELEMFLNAIWPAKPEQLPRGMILGTVHIFGCSPIEELYGGKYDTPKERLFGDWSAGRFGWLMSKPNIFPVPIPAKGSQGFWEWKEESV